MEPPGLFRGRGEHPKMGKVKKRVYPRDITINIGESVTGSGMIMLLSCRLQHSSGSQRPAWLASCLPACVPQLLCSE